MIQTKATARQSLKIQPKLRMFANGSSEVNVLRAEHASALAAPKSPLLRKVAAQRGELAVALTKSEVPATVDVARRTLDHTPDDVLANVFVHTLDRARRVRPLPGETARRGDLTTATVSLADLRRLAARPDVAYIELGQSLAAPTPIISNEATATAPAERRRWAPVAKHRGGEGVLIGVIDVQGFDFAHPDFLNPDGTTRWVRIWDQGGDARPSPTTGPPFNYGAELLQKHLNEAIAAAPSVRVPAQELERQSQMAEASHGTHVASIAAGNSGLCPKAMLAGVLISLPEADLDRRVSFYDSTRIAHAVDYLIGLADEMHVPLSINVSLGTNGHAHDASAAVSRWIDAALTVPGRSVCVAAGNAGQDVAAFEGDIGYVMGRIHTSGKIAARGLVTDIEWLVAGNGVLDISENELEIWYSPQDRFAVSVRPPGGDWIGPIDPRQYVENRQLADGSFLSIYNELYHPANGANWVSVYLSPLLRDGAVVGIPAGQWTVRLHGLDVRDGHFHGWIERDDPRRVGRVGPRQAWSFPSFFSEQSNVDNSSVSSLACGHRVISVANLDEAAERVNITSSQGPTRDGRCKPDVAAPGTDIVAAKGFGAPGDPWVKMTGTSMASPFVAGVVGLMLAVEPKLTAAQIEGIIHRTARPLPGADFQWANDAGFGRIDPEACLAEAAEVGTRKDITR
ncbi:MAG: S8 family serine peptidase [Acidobacteriota bacterium]